MSNKSVAFYSDRGNDNYYEKEVITIKIDAGSAPLINTQDSYLTFSIRMNRDGVENGAFVVPDSKLGCCPWENISIFDGNQETLLEQMSGISLWQCMKNYYGNNVNDDHLQQIFLGRTLEENCEYISDNDGAGNLRQFPVIDTIGPTAYPQPSKGGGFGSQYYELNNTGYTGDPSRKVQIIYRFPMSGLLSSLKKEILPLVVLNGLTIKLTLMEGAKFLRLQKVKTRVINSSDEVSIGYGIIDEEAATQSLPINAGATAFIASQTVYGIDGYVSDAAGTVVDGDVAVGNIHGLVLRATGGNKYNIKDLNNCSIKVGSHVGVGLDGAFNALPFKIPNDVSHVQKLGDGRICILFGLYALGTQISRDNPCVCYVADGLKSQYTINDLRMVCNVVEADPQYVQGMIQQAQNGQLRIQYNSYTDNRINIVTGALSNEIFIPTDLQRCYSILALNEELRGHSLLRSDFTPSVVNLADYQWIFSGQNVPNIPIDLSRVADGLVSPLAIIETEKSLDESSISVRNIQNPSNFHVIGRRLGAYGNSVSLLDKTVKCRINYNTNQNKALLWHFFIYHTKMITFQGNSRVVME